MQSDTVEATGQPTEPRPQRKEYSPPQLVTYGDVEALTQNTGILITDTLLSGSTL